MKKFNRGSPYIASDDKLKKALLNIKDDIEIIIETGTLDGQGSTKMLAEIFNFSKTLEKLYTIEIDNFFHLIAKKNLNKYIFVECLHGLSLNYEDCINYMKSDEYVINHKEFDHIITDDFINDDALLTYSLELKGNIFHRENKENFEQNLLIKKLEENINKKLLILLDSSGGVGYLEFLKTIEILKDNSYYLLLDDINHAKHYRSYLYIKDNENFKMLEIDFDKGYLLCKKV